MAHLVGNRWWMLAWLVLGVAIAFAGIKVHLKLDRSNIAMTILEMSQQFAWSQGTQGVILSAFFWGYLATQIIGGWMADRWGGKQVLAMAASIWSIFTILTPMANGNLPLVLAARVAMGLGEGNCQMRN